MHLRETVSMNHGLWDLLGDPGRSPVVKMRL